MDTSAMHDVGMVLPVLALVGWTFVMWIWMYVTRIPAMRAANIDLEVMRQSGAKLELPANIARIADNYNHLHEQPTIFYALALAAQLAAAVDMLSVVLAWGYVAVRIAHSLIQATANVIMLRFSVFTFGSLVLFALFVNTLVQVLTLR